MLAGVIYQPYYVLSMLAAALVVWRGVQAWDFTRTLTAPRLALVVGLLLVSLAVMTTQSFNPFIYFIF